MLNHWKRAVAAAGLGLAIATLTAHAQAAFTPLFDGTLKGWAVENTTAGNIKVDGGVLRVEAPSGWLRSERQFTDFTLRAQFRFMTDDADSGVFFRTGTGIFMRGWPNNSYQVQVRNPATRSRLPAVGGLFRHGMPPGEITLDEAAVEKLSRGTGQWQDLEVTVSGESLTVRLNGTEISRATNIVRQAGHIGLQAETGAVEYRAIEISAN